MKIEDIKKVIVQNKVKWSTHCLERMQERDISRADVRICIINGEIIEDYPNDYPYPSCLIFGHTENNKVLHVVMGMDNEFIYVITAYFPNTEKFEADLKTRR